MSYQDQSELRFSSDMSSFLKAVGYIGLLALVIGILFLVLGCFRISSYAFKTYESIDKIPHNKVGLLLGTSSLNSNGQPNDYFTYRIIAAAQLFKAGKIDYILASGDNLHHSYNEPRQMIRALIKAGVPQERIVADFAGISTLDSVIRARKVFLLNSVTIISQDFQNERALFIADSNGLNAVAYNALSPSYGIFSKINIREFFARIKCAFDVYLLKSQPKFLGKPESIGKSALPKELSNKPKKQTSALKFITDGAKILQERARIAKFEPLAKKTTDTAKTIKHLAEQAAYEELNRPLQNVPETSHEADSQQIEILSEEQTEALEEASEVASESLNVGTNNTYIDPNIPTNKQKRE